MGRREEDNVDQDSGSRNIRWGKGIKLHNMCEPLASCPEDIPTSASKINKPPHVWRADSPTSASKIYKPPHVRRVDSSCGFLSSVKTLAVPRHKVSSIIGRGGENLKWIEVNSGARIVVSHTRDVDLFGTPEQIRRAEQLIQHLLGEDTNARYINQSSPSSDSESFIVVDGFQVKLKYYDLYISIRAKYGDLRRPSVLDASEMAVVWVISDILSIVHAMSQVSLLNVTVDILDEWNKKIYLAEHLNYNVAWLRDHFEELQSEFERQDKIDAGLAELSSYSKVKQNDTESIEAMIAFLTSRIESARKSSSKLQSHEEDLLAQITIEKQEDDALGLRYSNCFHNSFILLSSLLSTKLFFFCFLMFVMFIVFP